jgi:hypothetical protein
MFAKHPEIAVEIRAAEDTKSMEAPMIRPVAVAALALLSACNGGGGSGNDNQLQLNFAAHDTTEAFSFLGQNVVATTDDHGNLTAITIGDNSFSGDAISEANANTSLGDIAEMLRAVRAGETAQDFLLDNETLKNAAFGLVADGQSTDAFAFGIPTPQQNVPTSGEATYSGRTIGAGTDGGGTQFAFTGDAQIHANFATGAVSANLSDFTTQSVAAGVTAPQIPDLSGSGNFITPGNYTAGLASEGKVGGVPVWLGLANGRLFGTNGQETAGVWSAQNNTDNIAVEGAFGAK